MAAVRGSYGFKPQNEFFTAKRLNCRKITPIHPHFYGYAPAVTRSDDGREVSPTTEAKNLREVASQPQWAHLC